ncbi:formimidoylglutamate deiminase [Pontibacter beigongshangensis]|uniref:formimidoylglutamate deiminase n=1 Tax=Pontibacter beigongshangensis TaxID=2574733 RepID=UPI00164FB812|nr:formimidoylglutamate deiminase [Pontibacter beigongshangensis]
MTPQISYSTVYRFDYLLLKDAWMQPAYVGIDREGVVQYLSSEKPATTAAIEAVAGAALPGFQNAHSHAFQFGMAGMAEIHEKGAADDFWTWREAMYTCALRYNPSELKSVAVELYRQMLRNGYTQVAEFHYLHHDKEGKPYANLAETGERLVEAAAEAGIKITLIPVFYQKGDFGKEPHSKQRRFISKDTDAYLKLLESSLRAISGYPKASLGFGVHSLRAVAAAAIVATYANGPKGLPFHVHAAEQLKEVEACVEYLGQRPVEWLLNNMAVGPGFHLVHCTHMTTEETKRLAQSGATVILCPGTEANLGDGIFSLGDYAGHGGAWAIGTDSQISLNPLEDLRWLDYAQRLTTHKRNTFDNGAAHMVRNSILHGRKAMGENAEEYFSLGKPLDAAVYDLTRPALAQANPTHLLPAIVYTADSSALLGTMVNGKWV